MDPMVTHAQLIEAARKVTSEFPLSRKEFSAGSCGAALVTEAGNVYTGICIDVACGMGFCAEHAAVAEMLKHRETKIRAVVATSEKGIVPPCGRCREMMLQIDRSNDATEVILGDDLVLPLNELLPKSWISTK